MIGIEMDADLGFVASNHLVEDAHDAEKICSKLDNHPEKAGLQKEEICSKPYSHPEKHLQVSRLGYPTRSME